MFTRGKPPPTQRCFSYVQCSCVSMCWLVDGTVEDTAWNGVVVPCLCCSTDEIGVVNKFKQYADILTCKMDAYRKEWIGGY